MSRTAANIAGALASAVFSWRFGLLTLPLLLLIVLGLGCYQALNRLTADTVAVEKSQASLALAQEFLSCLKDAETGQRGFLLTGRNYYLEPYNAALQNFDNLHGRLMQTAVSTGQARTALHRIDSLSRQKLAIMQETIRLYQEGNTEAALSFVKSDQGKQTMDEIRRLVQILSSTERQSLIHQFISRQRTETAFKRFIVGGGIAFACVLAVCAFILAWDGEKQRRTESALRESEENHQHAVNLNPQIPWTADPQGRILNLSEKWNTVTGMPLADILEGRWMQHVHPDDRKRMAEAWNTSIQTGHPLDIEYRQELRDGSYVWMRTRAFPERSSQGRIIKWYGTSEDISDRKTAEEQLQKAHEKLLEAHTTLEVMVQDRTRELVQANLELNEVNKELETFAYTSSHDLRAPVRNIDNLSQILFEDYGQELSEEVAGYIRRMRIASQKVGRLIDDLLAFSRLNREEMEISEVNLSDLADDIVSGLRASEPDRAVAVFVQRGMTAWGSPHLLSVVLDNLLGNAWKYTSKNPEARIEFTTDPEEESVFVIRDNGVGFDMRHAALLFAPFQRLHKQTEFSGTGIGLATVQRILRRHKGKIWAEAKPGEGAAFRFTLPPRHKQEENNGAEQSAAAVGGR